MKTAEFRTATLQCGQTTIRVHRPILTQAEAEKRQRKAQLELVAGLTSYIKRKECT